MILLLPLSLAGVVVMAISLALAHRHSPAR